MRVYVILLFASICALAQDTMAVLDGEVTDASGSVLVGATVQVTNEANGYSRSQSTTNTGTYHLILPAGEYELRVSAPRFNTAVRHETLSVSQSARVNFQLEIGKQSESVDVQGDGLLVESGSTTIGNVVTGRELVDLPLNGRNFTELGRLQPGVSPLTAGVMQAGGSLRGGQAYAVNGQRPESNNYLLDGTTNVNRVDGGYALKTPVDAIQEFRILTETAPAEFGGTSGATTTVVTRSGTNDFHGDIYEFLRNDALDARNFFAAEVEPLKQNQFGATFGGPVRKNRDFFFVYYEGFRDREGITNSATVPSEAQRTGDFSELRDPQTGQPIPLINRITGKPFPDNQIPAEAINPLSLSLLSLYPHANAGPNLFIGTETLSNDSDQGGTRFDHVFREADQISFHYVQSASSLINPFSVKGANVPGFPVKEDISTNAATISETHSFSGATLNVARIGFFRNIFDTDQPINRTSPRELGFNYDTTFLPAQGPPFFILNGYATAGNPNTGPRDTTQNTYEAYDSLSHTTGGHNLKAGVDFRRTQINLSQGTVSNGYFVFGPFPASDSFASFLLGAPLAFLQAGGDVNRGLRSTIFSVYLQDSWRVTPRFTINYGFRWEVDTPFTDIRGRIDSWSPGKQSVVFKNAPVGLLFPGDPGVPDGIAPVYWKGLMPRLGFAWDPAGSGSTSIRAAYGIFYDSVTNGLSAPLLGPVLATPWLQLRQPAQPINFADPWHGTDPFTPNSFPQPVILRTIQNGMRPPYAQNWNFSVQRSLARDYLLDVRYIGNKGTRLPRAIEANPALYQPGATSANADRRRIYAGCHGPTGPCDFSSVGIITDSTNSTYHAGQASLTKRFANGLAFVASYTYSKTLDYASSISVSGTVPRLYAGENDLAQNPFDLKAEHGPSIFDARHRFVLSGSYELPFRAANNWFERAFVAGWQVNTIANFSSGTPFTVYDTANVSLQATAPEITGTYSSRPDLVADPNAGARTVEAWVPRSAFRRLDPVTEAGQFGNEGRNVIRGPAIANVDVSVLKNFVVTETIRVQFRAECFNVANHANFGLPDNNVADLNFGRISTASSPRLFQAALKFIF
jgi:hypothetical protein